MQTGTMTQALVSRVYERMFGDETLHFDMYEGTVKSQGDSRVIYLSADIIRGIYDALQYEAGEAWGLILRSAGLRWGRRISKSMDKELRVIASRKLDAITVKEYTDLLESYFNFHGWGLLEVNLDDAETSGFVRCEVRNSIFGSVLKQVEGPVNQMLEGMLAGMFESMAGQTVDCIEIVSPHDRSHSTFLISGSHRIDALRALSTPVNDPAAAMRILREQ